LAASPFDAAIAATRSPFHKTLTALYAQNGGRGFWTGAANSDKLNTLLDLLDDPYFNYKHKPFNRAAIDDLLMRMGSDIQPAGLRAKLDVALTDGFLRLVRFVRVGDVDWHLVRRKMARLKATQDVRATWEIHPRTMPSVAAIRAALQKGDIYRFLAAQIPEPRRYKQLITLLGKYRAMPPFKKIPYG